MGDSFLIYLSKNPFSVSILAFGLTAFFLFFGRKSIKFQLLGFAIFFVGIGFASLLHFRWDSFSIHLCKINTHNFEKNKILFVGDSITAEGTRPRGFITKLESILHTQSETIFAKGATSEQIISLVESNTHNFQPDYIIAQSGINDLISGLSESETSKSQNKLLDSIRSTFPSSIVLFIHVHPFFIEKHYFTPSKTYTLKTDGILWWGEPNNFAENYLNQDGIHLNAKGHTLLAKNLAQQLTQNI